MTHIFLLTKAGKFLCFNFIPVNKECVVSDPLKHEDCFNGRTIKRELRGSRRGGLRGGKQILTQKQGKMKQPNNQFEGLYE